MIEVSAFIGMAGHDYFQEFYLRVWRFQFRYCRAFNSWNMLRWLNVREIRFLTKDQLRWSKY